MSRSVVHKLEPVEIYASDTSDRKVFFLKALSERNAVTFNEYD